ncbi:MAG TPA: right-handed parallel beta-helix repeat-containing protein [Gemmataceae bacterium]|nr:right-handed parallel beta-helix repeat-containing protein [Gemmataceae bacterium]
MISTIRRLVRTRKAPHNRRTPPSVRLRLQPLEDRTVPSTLLVDDDRRQFRNAPFTTIQSAVNSAHSGDLIYVAKGVYQEQIVFPSTLRNVFLLNAGGALIGAQPGAGDGSGAIIHVNGAQGITISGFTITGGVGTADLQFGVLVDHSGSATISYNHIINIQTNPLGTNQGAAAIQIGESSTGTPGVGNIIGNRIESYQKGGVVVIGAGSNADVIANTVRGVGPTTVIAQNGIQVSDGATGRVLYNTVSGNQFVSTTTEGVGILVFSTANVRVEANTVTTSDEGILVDSSTGVSVQYNTSNKNTLNGIGVLGGSNNLVRFNTTLQNVFDGINLEDTTGNSVEGNTAWNNGRDGVALEATVIGNAVRRNSAFRNGRFDLSDASASFTNSFSKNSFKTRGAPTFPAVFTIS